MSKFIKILIAFAIVFAGFSSVTSLKTHAASSSIQAVVPVDGGGGGVKGGYVRATHNYTRGTAITEDYFMTVADGKAAATKLGFNAKSFVTWTAIGFIPKVGAFATIAVGLSSARANEASVQIRALTDRGKKVKLTVVEDKGLTYYLVKEWNGTVSSIKPHQLLVGVAPVVTKKIYK